jgi:hypothetical protein
MQIFWFFFHVTLLWSYGDAALGVDGLMRVACEAQHRIRTWDRLSKSRLDRTHSVTLTTLPHRPHPDGDRSYGV